MNRAPGPGSIPALVQDQTSLDDDAGEDTLTGVSDELRALVEKVDEIDAPATDPGVDFDDEDTGVD